MAFEKLKIQHNSSEWLAFRRTGIGGSDAAAILGKSPFKSNVDVWEEKTGRKTPDDISDNPQVKYGVDAEGLLCQLFALDYPQYELKIDKTTVYKRGFMFASLDGELTDRETGARGIYEGKTTEIHSGAALEKWNNQIPEYYFVQLLHYFIVTDCDFAVLKAQIKQTGRNGEVELITRHYTFKRDDIRDQLEYVYLREKDFWNNYVLADKRPPRILPAI